MTVATKPKPGPKGSGHSPAPKKRKRVAGDPQILRRRPRHVGELDVVEWVKASRFKLETPEGQAQELLKRTLNQLGIDPLIVASPVHLSLVQIMQELLIESEPDDDLDTVLEPLFALYGEQMATAGREKSQAAMDAKVAAAINDVLNAWLSLHPREQEPGRRVAAIAKCFASEESDVAMSDDTIRKHLAAALDALKTE